VLKHKSLIMVSVLVLVMALVAISCAPAKPVTPPVVVPPVVVPPVVVPPGTAPVVPVAPVMKTSYEATTYTNDKYGFSILYPKSWTSEEAKLSGGVLYVKGDKGLVYVAVRPSDPNDWGSTAMTFLQDLIKAGGKDFTPGIDSNNPVTFTDGKTKGRMIMLSAAFGLAKGACAMVMKDGNAIIVLGGTDPGQMDLYKEIGNTLSIK
jgi:hypothetical protein